MLDTFTIPRYQSLLKSWQKHPPTNLLVAGFVGFNGKDGPDPETQGQDLLDLMG